MIIWIASYPRSGNTLTRKIIEDCFGVETYTAYKGETETQHLFNNQEKYDLNDKEVYNTLAASEETYFIKTHHVPFDGFPVIHVVRNGRNAISSLAKYQGVDAPHAIIGQSDGFASWSDHYWGLAGLPNTLQVRFEDLLEDTDTEINRIGHFVGMEKKADFVNDFNPVNPTMGTGGKHKAEFTQAEELLFQRCHGVVMGVLGYA